MAEPAHPHEPQATDTNVFDRVLSKRRATAAEKEGYSSQETTDILTEEFKTRTGGKEPYSWQLDVAEALILKLDCIVVAGTGVGKTMPFVMPLFVDKTRKRKVIVVSALNQLQEDQARRFRELGLAATAINQDTWSEQLNADIVANKYQVLLCGPEMMLEHAGFSKLLRTSSFTDDIAAVIVDEAHCVSHWGYDFRKQYGELGTLRSFVPLEVPFLATSATMPPRVLAEVQDVLQFSAHRTFSLNLGNDRPNITPLAWRMRSTKDMDALNFVIDEAKKGEELQQTLIYVNTQDLAHDVWEHLVNKVPKEYREQIDFVHARRSRRAKALVIERFRKGKIKILVATEVAGMGMDITHIVHIVQFMVPRSLSEWVQHFGHAGRAGQPAVIILFVEPSIFKKVRKRSKKMRANNTGKRSKVTDVIDDDVMNTLERATAVENCESDTASTHVRSNSTNSQDSNASLGTTGDEALSITGEVFEYQKKVELGLRYWIEAKRCRREVTDIYFSNPPRPLSYLTVSCCDLRVLCKAEDPAKPEMTEAELKISSLVVCLGAQNSSNEDGEPRTRKRQKCKDGEGPRKGDHLESCQNTLLSWHRWRWNQSYTGCHWSWEALLPEKDLEVLAKGAHVHTIVDIKTALPDWPFADDHSEELLDRLRPFDDEWNKEQIEKAAKKKVQRRHISEVKKDIRNEARREEKHVKRQNCTTASRATQPRQPVASSSRNLVPSGMVQGVPPPYAPPPPGPAHQPVPHALVYQPVLPQPNMQPPHVQQLPPPEPPPANEQGWTFFGFTLTPLASPTPPPDLPHFHMFEDGSGYVYGGPLPTLKGSPVSYDGFPPHYGVMPCIPSPATERHHAALLAERLALLTLDAPHSPSPPCPLPNWDLDDFDEWDPRDPDFLRMWALVQELFNLSNSCALDTLLDRRYLRDN